MADTHGVKESVSNRMIIGITGASGALYGIRTLSLLREKGFETHLILSKAGKQVIELETDYTARDAETLASHTV